MSFVLIQFILLVSAKAYGLSNVTPESRIVGGKNTTIEKHPYQVSLLKSDTHVCGGSILNSNHILTAAHCTEHFSPKDLSVRAGSSIRDQGGQVIPVKNFFEHSNFDSGPLDYDIAILRLSQDLTFGPGVAPVKLPEQDEGDIDGGLVGVATGWGWVTNIGPLATVLQEVNLPTIAAGDCTTNDGRNVTKRMFCAGYPKGQMDACEGDSGGPFVYNGVQIGITSWGIECGQPNLPGVFTKVQYFRTFIDKVLES